MTEQEMFDKCGVHMLTQNARSIDRIGNCMYRNPDGLKCALGCLIPDEKYSLGLEGYGLLNSKTVQEVIGITEPKAVAFANRLQYIHDSREPYQWREALRVLARAFGLSTAAIDAVSGGAE